MVCHRCGCPHSDFAAHCPFCGAASPIPQRQAPIVTKRGKRLPVIILALLFLIGTLLFFLIPMDPGASAAAPSVTDSNAMFQKDCFILKNGVLYFDGSSYTQSPILIVPARIDGQPVTAIGDGCFENVSGITTIMLPSSITSIGERAFAQCGDLRGLRISESVTSIGAEAFADCASLEAVFIPAAVTSIGEDAFHDCTALLYLFYNGYYSALYDMYPQVISPFTWAICLDGEYRHGGI